MSSHTQLFNITASFLSQSWSSSWRWCFSVLKVNFTDFYPMFQALGCSLWPCHRQNWYLSLSRWAFGHEHCVGSPRAVLVQQLKALGCSLWPGLSQNWSPPSPPWARSPLVPCLLVSPWTQVKPWGCDVCSGWFVATRIKTFWSLLNLEHKNLVNISSDDKLIFICIKNNSYYCYGF